MGATSDTLNIEPENGETVLWKGGDLPKPYRPTSWFFAISVWVSVVVTLIFTIDWNADLFASPWRLFGVFLLIFVYMLTFIESRKVETERGYVDPQSNVFYNALITDRRLILQNSAEERPLVFFPGDILSAGGDYQNGAPAIKLTFNSRFRRREIFISGLAELGTAKSILNERFIVGKA